jgi:hypothetical protein
MCYLCMKDDVILSQRPNPGRELRERAVRIKAMLREAEENEGSTCHIGEAAVQILKQEQYELARQL